MSRDAIAVELTDLLRDAVKEAATQTKRSLEPELAAQLLRDAFAKLSERHEFQPGDMIQKKRGLEEGTKEWRGGMAIFVRYASGIETQHEAGMCVPRYDLDCVVGTLTSDGALIEFTGCSRYFEPATGGDKVNA